MAKVLLLADHTANKTHVCAICLENDWNQYEENMKEYQRLENDLRASAAVEYYLGDELFWLKNASLRVM